MPSAVTPLRRSREYSSEDEGDENTPGTSAHSFGSKKRARFSTNGASISQKALLANGFSSQLHGASQAEVSRSRKAPMDHQPGSIVRVKLTNFVTYTAVEFFPGPSLNMVIGPNGTGKSTLVCAICLGLGWGAQHLGRAKDVSEYVKHGSQEAWIEIELARDIKRSSNPVILCNIKREGNKSEFSIDGRHCSKKAVMELARSYSIQIDNLCQFLPQDKVVEFAAMTPIELLCSTQRAVAPREMIDLHDQLKEARHDQRKIQIQNASDLETLANLEGRQRMQEADVERMREREQIIKRTLMLESARPFPEYRQVRTAVQEAKARKKESAKELKDLEESVEPILQAVNAKQRYHNQIKFVVEERKRVVDKADRKADSLAARLNALEDQIKDIEKEKDAEKKGSKTNKGELSRHEQIIDRLKRQIQEPPPEMDVSIVTERLRANKRADQENNAKAEEIQKTMGDLARQGRDKNIRIDNAKRELSNLESQVGQQNNKLEKTARESAIAWKWIQAHQDEFNKPVYGPPIVECSVKDPRYVDLIEGTFSNTDFTCFTVQSREDFNKLHFQLYNRMRLSQINIRTMTGGLSNFRPPISDEETQRYGFDGWALDFINGPEPVLAMLCAEGPRLHQTAVSLRDTTSQQYDMLQDSPVASWITSKSHYKISRRREYGPGATSTQVRDVRPARIWTDQPVDLTAKRELQENIEGWTEEIDAIQGQIENSNNEVKLLRSKRDELVQERESVAKEKEIAQKAMRAFQALPTRLVQEEKKLADVQKLMQGVKERYQALQDNQDTTTLQKGEASLEFAKAVEVLTRTHNDLHEAELMLIEATSDVEVLTERNGAVKQQLDAKRYELEVHIKQLEVATAKARKVYERVKEAFATGDEEHQAFWRTLPEGQTIEQLETEIQSEKARLELMHEGNDGVIREFEQRQMKIDRLREKLEGIQQSIQEIDEKIKEIQENWEPRLDKLIKRISESFGYNMKQINCAGEVEVYKDEQDFGLWAIQIRVKFRENEPLTLLDSHRQSGGERAVSTIFYLMSLQSLTRSPFRVVDEINQGMDPRNERLVHARMVSIATGNDDQQFQLDEDDGPDGKLDGANDRSGSQYFLITPKLLHGLKYERGMRVLCIASGEYMPEDQMSIDFKACVAIREKTPLISTIG